MGADRERGPERNRGAVAPGLMAERDERHDGLNVAGAAVAGDPGRSRLPPSILTALQRAAGNSATGLVVQRWTVPSSLACDEVVPHMDSSSPYAPEWAQTQSTHTFHGSVRVRHDTAEDGTVTSTAKGHPGLRVTVQSPVDRPQWNPSPRPNRHAERAAFQSMRASLDAHEAEHQQIGRDNNAELQRRYRGVDITVTGDSAESNTQELVSQLRSDQQGWQTWAQEQQDAIDPFRGAVMACPAPPEETEG